VSHADTKERSVPPDKDAELVERACAGDADAFGILVQRYEVALFNFMLKTCRQRELAKDLCQDAFLKAFKALPGFRVGAPFKPWLFKIAVNGAFSWSRRAQRREMGVDSIPEPAEPVGATGMGAPVAADAHISGKQAGAGVMHALAQLPEDVRAAVMLKYVEEFTYEEMADILGDKVPALKMRVHRGLARLRETLKEQGAAGDSL
jgi:RNA polymerase sigma-70 factor (ECF subfamily)